MINALAVDIFEFGKYSFDEAIAILGCIEPIYVTEFADSCVFFNNFTLDNFCVLYEMGIDYKYNDYSIVLSSLHKLDIITYMLNTGLSQSELQTIIQDTDYQVNINVVKLAFDNIDDLSDNILSRIKLYDMTIEDFHKIGVSDSLLCKIVFLNLLRRLTHSIQIIILHVSEYLINNFDSNENAADMLGCFLLSIMKTKKSFKHIIRFVNAGANINYNPDIFVKIMCEYTEITYENINFLVDNECIIDDTWMPFAVKNNNYVLCEYLIENGTILNEKHIVIASNIQMFALFIKYGFEPEFIARQYYNIITDKYTKKIETINDIYKLDYNKMMAI